ncbi:MAG: signal peptidase I [Clostridia bacterium]|nr:signal peptidase I [Clostridia bacterium]
MKQSKGKKSKHTSLWRRILLVFLGLVVGVNMYLANARSLVGNQLPMPFGYGVAVVLSGSMEPTFSKNDLIVVKKSDDVKVGDVVVYSAGHSLVVHRVVAINGKTVTTKGDANNTADVPFDVSQIKGTVQAHISGLGVIVNALKSPLGFVSVLALAFLLIELSAKRQKKSDSAELDEIRKQIEELKQNSD